MHLDARELWGYCDPCHRWFFVPRRPDGQRPQPHEHRITCPVCIMPAGRFETRGETAIDLDLDHVAEARSA